MAAKTPQKHMKKWQSRTIQIKGKKVPVWPSNTKVTQLWKAPLFIAEFDDSDDYHEPLIQTLLERESDAKFGMELFKGACGVKVHHLDQWNEPAANLIHQRALALFSSVSKVENPVSDTSWGNVYRQGDYCMPHSHLRTQASIVYLLAPGDKDESNPLGGQLCFSDPRIPGCCQVEKGRVTNFLAPELKPGSMILFPSEAMHYVNPYTGNSPRITLSWNISPHRIPGSPNPGIAERRKKYEQSK